MRPLLALPLASILVTACAVSSAPVDGAPDRDGGAAAPTAAPTAAPAFVTCGGGDFELCVRPVEEQKKLSGPATFREGGAVMLSLDLLHGGACVTGSVKPDDASSLRVASVAPGTLGLEGRYCLAALAPDEERTDDCAATAGQVTVSYRGGVTAGRNVVRLGDQELAFDVPSVPPPEGVCVRFRASR